MAFEGPNSPAAVVDDTSHGGVAWSDPANAAASDNSRAIAALGANQTSHYLKATDFGFSIPEGSTIDGIVVEVEKRAQFGQNPSPVDSRGRMVKGGAVEATDKADTVTEWPDFDTYISYGGPADLWGSTWTPADVNAADFGFVIAASLGNVGSNGAWVDHIRITVHYTEPPSQTVVIGQAVETDTAQAFTAVLGGKTVVIGQAVETDTARPLTIKRNVPAGQALETDTAQAFSPHLLKIVPIGLASEIDTAQAFRVKVRERKPAAWTLYVRDSDLSRLGEIPDYQSLDLVLRFNGVGAWVLDLDNSTDAAESFDFDKGIVVARDGHVVLSGPVTGMKRQWDGDKDRLIVSGVSDTTWLARRIAYPEPGSNPPWTVSEHDVRTGAAETVLKEYVDANLGPAALVARQVPGLTIEADQARGTTVTGRARMHVLLDLQRDLALAGGDIGFDVIQEGAGIEFQVYEPRDQSAKVIFSADLGNLAEFMHDSKAAEANHFIGAGGGEGTSRTFVEKGDAVSIAEFGRIEEFRDRRDTTEVAEITQTLDVEIAEKAAQVSLSVTPTDTKAFRFIDDFTIGDKVTAVVDGIPIVDVIREMRISLSPDSAEKIIPTIGTPNTTDPKTHLQFLDALRSQRSRISNLERR